MNAIIEAATVGLIRSITTEFIAWQQRRAREAAWVPSVQEVEDFLKEIAADTPEALKARVAQALGLPWPPPTP